MFIFQYYDNQWKSPLVFSLAKIEFASGYHLCVKKKKKEHENYR